MYGSVDEFRYRNRERLRAFAREPFFPFYRLMFPTLAPEATFSGALHFQALAQALERVANGEIRRLLIAIRPGTARACLPRSPFPPGFSAETRPARSFAPPTAISCRRTSRTGSATSCGLPAIRPCSLVPSSRRTALRFRKSD